MCCMLRMSFAVKQEDLRQAPVYVPQAMRLRPESDSACVVDKMRTWCGLSPSLWHLQVRLQFQILPDVMLQYSVWWASWCEGVHSERQPGSSHGDGMVFWAVCTAGDIALSLLEVP
jgi:hypothetical protein